MPDIDVEGCVIHVETDGPEHAPVLMLSNSLGSDLTMWNSQVASFTRHFRLIRYDHRGHGKSDAPKGPYSMERLGRDALAILDQLGIDRINWCGLSTRWDDRPMAWCLCSRWYRQADPRQHGLLLSQSTGLARPGRIRARARHSSLGRSDYGTMVQQRIH